MFIEKEQQYFYYSLLFCLEDAEPNIAYVKTIFSEEQIIAAFELAEIPLLDIITVNYQEEIDYVVLE